MDSTTAIDAAVAELAHRGIIDVHRVAWHPRTAGPAVTAIHGTTGRRLFVGWEPSSATYTVECDGNSWSWVRPDRLAQAIAYHVDHWSDTWERLAERNAARADADTYDPERDDFAHPVDTPADYEHLCTIGRP